METPYDEMRRYVRFDAEQAALVQALGKVAAPSFPRIVEAFYDRIREHEDAHAVLVDEAQIARLQASLLRWLVRLCGGTYDAAYYEETAKIGRVHVRVGLPQRFVFTAMALISVSLNEIADREMGADAPRVRAAVTALLNLELGVMLETYREHFVHRIEQAGALERQALGRSLAKAEHRSASAIELARVLVIGLDHERTIRLFNREAERVTGFGRDEAIGQGFLELLVPPEARAVHAERLDEATRSPPSEGPRFEGLMLTRAGHLRHVQWQLAYSPSDSDDELSLYALGFDTTDEVARAEHVRQQEKLAAVGTLAAGLAHEIRNPLNGAQLHVAYLGRALKRDDARPDLQEAVAVVDDEIKRLANLVTEFLEFARPRPLARRAVSMRALGERVVQLAGALADAAGLRISVDVPAADVTVDADPDRLEQVLINLLRNAVEACASGAGTTVQLRARRQPRHVVLEVEDDGPGLARPDAPIFDAFFSTKAAGTGLGLAITHRIVTDHGGSVDVDSRPGRTVFTLKFPLIHPDRPIVMPGHRDGEIK